MIIDIANRGTDIFEGSQVSLPLSIVDGQTEVRDLGGQKIPVPKRSVLLIMKFKAAWDRSWRIRNGKSSNIDWDRSKMIKDHSDILALLDPDKNTGDLNITLLGDFFTEHEFMRNVFDEILYSKPAFNKYGIDPEKARSIIEGLRSMVL